MTDNEILSSLSNMLQPIQNTIKKMDLDIQVLKDDVHGLKRDMVEVKQDVQELKQDMVEVKKKVQRLEDKVENLEKNVHKLEHTTEKIETRIIKLEIIHENDILPRLQDIEACYTSTYRRYQAGVEQIDELQMDVDVVKTVLIEHSEKLQKIS